MNTIDSTKYPYNEEAGGHTWTRWKIGHSGINAAYAQAERKYYNEGARFAKWRAVFKIGVGMPSERAITENANSLNLQKALFECVY